MGTTVMAHAIPKLKTVNANLSPRAVYQEIETDPDLAITKQYKRYPYIKFSRTAVDGYVNTMWKQSDRSSSLAVPQTILKLCQTYYVSEEDGVYQIACKLANVMNKIRRQSITYKALVLIITKYLKLKETTQAQTYCDALIRLKYIVPANIEGDSVELYTFSKHFVLMNFSPL